MYLSSFVNIHSFGQIIKAGALFSELLLTSLDLGHSRLSGNWLPPAVPLAGPVLNTLDSLGGTRNAGNLPQGPTASSSVKQRTRLSVLHRVSDPDQWMSTSDAHRYYIPHI